MPDRPDQGHRSGGCGRLLDIRRRIQTGREGSDPGNADQGAACRGHPRSAGEARCEDVRRLHGGPARELSSAAFGAWGDDEEHGRTGRRSDPGEVGDHGRQRAEAVAQHVGAPETDAEDGGRTGCCREQRFGQRSTGEDERRQERRRLRRLLRAADQREAAEGKVDQAQGSGHRQAAGRRWRTGREAGRRDGRSRDRSATDVQADFPSGHPGPHSSASRHVHCDIHLENGREQDNAAGRTGKTILIRTDPVLPIRTEPVLSIRIDPVLLTRTDDPVPSILQLRHLHRFRTPSRPNLRWWRRCPRTTSPGANVPRSNLRRIPTRTRSAACTVGPLLHRCLPSRSTSSLCRRSLPRTTARGGGTTALGGGTIARGGGTIALEGGPTEEQTIKYRPSTIPHRSAPRRSATSTTWNLSSRRPSSNRRPSRHRPLRRLQPHRKRSELSIRTRIPSRGRSGTRQTKADTSLPTTKAKMTTRHWTMTYDSTMKTRTRTNQ